MRILVVSPPKTGNIWVKLLLAEIYELQVINDVPRIPLRFLREFIDDGRFHDDSIFHQHFRPEKAFFQLAGQVNAHLVTTIRHPYDVFVSLYFYVQRLSHLFQEGTPFYPIIGKSLEDDAVIRFLKRGDDGFGFQVDLALAWQESGRSILVRYEDLVADTFGAVKEITDRIDPVPESRIVQAVENNEANRLRKKSLTLNRHIRKGTTGDWRNHLTKRHLEAINSHHGSKIERLGYSLYGDPAD